MEGEAAGREVGGVEGVTRGRAAACARDSLAWRLRRASEWDLPYQNIHHEKVTMNVFFVAHPTR